MTEKIIWVIILLVSVFSASLDKDGTFSDDV
jgi:hypothetical protein